MSLSIAFGATFDEVGIKNAVASMWPKYSSLQLKQIASGGTDNSMYRLGKSHVVRVPLHEYAAKALQREVSVLRQRKFRTLEVPTVCEYAKVTDRGVPIALYSWMDGEDYFTVPPHSPDEAAERLSRFLLELRANKASDEYLSEKSDNRRGVPLEDRDPATQKSILEIADEFDAKRLLNVWKDALAAKPHNGPPVWLHGDLHAGNLITQNGVLAGVIDFGLCAVGDPAADIPPAWWLFDGEARQVFRRTLKIDENEWRRGRGWALHNAVIAYSYYRDKDKLQLIRMSRDAIVRLLDEAS
ncbi:aminoglycoside phosphotransferase family protein [Maritalea porphyrae]|uniref:aminoglycoside phosphotransferase family protein n=1 Tax=Maritalea porphyrae TaxID=880732 RepID=UPI0022B07778|nr:aminoglycoside phosphotransferase family protein [Maritalea porphyrae]MCZ4271426.1 aminoglycoside phosphotransferase family protein [Maritalea porphyrae]